MSGNHAPYYANKVLRAAEQYFAANTQWQQHDSGESMKTLFDAHDALLAATERYMQETGREHVNGPNIDADIHEGES